jgi:hypothetical protein
VNGEFEIEVWREEERVNTESAEAEHRVHRDRENQEGGVKPPLHFSGRMGRGGFGVEFAGD